MELEVERGRGRGRPRARWRASAAGSGGGGEEADLNKVLHLIRCAPDFGRALLFEEAHALRVGDVWDVRRATRSGSARPRRAPCGAGRGGGKKKRKPVS